MNRQETIILPDDPLWYKDAVIYEVHVKTFRDSTGNGIGDFPGLISKLDYLQELGITAIWLLPFYPSPLKDDGYDIADYTDVSDIYGDMKDFKDLVHQAHRRGIRVITEVVLNHTSDQHPWFQKSRAAPKGSPWRDFYVWSDSATKYGDTRIIFKDFETSNWTWDPVAKAYFWHRFYHHQPDLNFDNPRVQKAVLAVVDFWMEKGVDGLRLDAIPYLYEREGTNCENLPETHTFIRKLRAYVDKKHKNKMLLAEANQWNEDTVAYFGQGDECHMAFNFPVMPRMYIALQMEERFPLIDILDPALGIPGECQWALFLRNHDELTLEMVTDEERDYMYRYFASDPRAKINLGIRRRLAPLLNNNRRRIELLNILLFSLPGTPVLYYGDEIGMGDNFFLGDRDGVRTPMQWSTDRNAGFSSANPQSLYLPLIIDPEYHYEVVNVENQEKNLSSLLWWMRRVIAMRKKYKAFGRGTIRFLSPQNTKILSFLRQYEEEVLLVVINLSRFAQSVQLDLSEYRGCVLREVFSQNEFPPINDRSYPLTLGQHDYFWFRLIKPEVDLDGKGQQTQAKIVIPPSADGRLPVQTLELLEQEVLPCYLKKARWFSGKAKSISKLSIEEVFRIPIEDHPSVDLFFLEITFSEGEPAHYLLPLMTVMEEKAKQIEKAHPRAVVAEVVLGESRGVLIDAMIEGAFQQTLLRLIRESKTLRGIAGRIVGQGSRRFRKRLEDEGVLPSKILGAEQSNSSVIFGEQLILKMYRKLEEGIHTDAEIVRALTEKAGFANTPPFIGAIEYLRPGKVPITLGLLQGYVSNEGDAWSFTLAKVKNYLEHLLVNKDRARMNPPEIPFFPADLKAAIEDRGAREMVGEMFAQMVAMLAKRTGELHLALASLAHSPEFTPEPFSTIYQRSIYQSMLSLTRSVLRSLDKSLPGLPEAFKPLARSVLASQSRLTERFSRVTGRKISGMKIRIHGDYHLGQVLFTGKDFMIIDFEGEPLRPLSERRLKRSPLRDVAGMLRSFHYAAFAGLFQFASIHPVTTDELEVWMKPWVHYVSNVFLEAYFETVKGAPFIPSRGEELVALLDAFLLEKAVYELSYELNNRPDWVFLPLKGIDSLLAEEHGQERKG